MGAVPCCAMHTRAGCSPEQALAASQAWHARQVSVGCGRTAPAHAGVGFTQACIMRRRLDRTGAGWPQHTALTAWPRVAALELRVGVGRGGCVPETETATRLGWKRPSTCWWRRGSMTCEREGTTENSTSCMTEYSYAKCSEHATMPTSMPISRPCSTAAAGSQHTLRLRHGMDSGRRSWRYTGVGAAGPRPRRTAEPCGVCGAQGRSAGGGGAATCMCARAGGQCCAVAWEACAVAEGPLMHGCMEQWAAAGEQF